MFVGFREKINIILKFSKFFKKFSFKDFYGAYPIVEYFDIELYNYGFFVNLDVAGFCSFADIESKKDFLITLFDAADIVFKKNTLEFIINPIMELNYNYINLSPYELLMGFDYRGTPITVNMKQSPHLLVTGLSMQGKTGMLKIIIKNLRNADIILCRAFADDFNDFNCRKILDEQKMLDFFNQLLIEQRERERPLYIFIEELATLQSKELTNVIKKLLCVARHYDIYIIGVIQIATKEELKFKSYFNCRVSFKQQDLSSYQVALGCTVNNDLMEREFFLMDKCLVKGKTYNF